MNTYDVSSLAESGKMSLGASSGIARSLCDIELFLLTVVLYIIEFMYVSVRELYEALALVAHRNVSPVLGMQLRGHAVSLLPPDVFVFGRGASHPFR